MRLYYRVYVDASIVDAFVLPGLCRCDYVDAFVLPGLC